MHWLVLLAFVVIELYVALILVKTIAFLPWTWLRWPAWASLGVITSFLLGTGAFGTLYHLVHWLNEDWQTGFSPRAPFPTARLFLAVGGSAFPLFLFGAGVFGLIRTRNEPRRPRANQWTFRGMITGMLTVSLIFLALFVADDLLLRRRLRALATAATAQAMEVAPRECEPNENAAELYEAVALQRNTLRQAPRGGVPENLEMLRDDAWSAYLSENAELAEIVRTGASLACCRFDTDWSRPSVFTETPELDDLSACTTLLLAEGHRALLDRDADRAFANVMALRRIAVHASSDPREIAQLVAAKSEGCAVRLLEHSLFVRNPTKKELAALVRPDFEFRTRFQRSLIWQQAESFNAMRYTYLGDSADEPLLARSSYSAVWFTANPISRLVFAGDDISALPRLFERIQGRAAVAYADSTSPDETTSSILRRTPLAWLERAGLVTMRTIPSKMALFSVCYRADAARSIADFALQLAAQTEIQILTTVDVDALVPERQRPIDPFAAKPLRIASADGGLILYSIGMNCQDDGGVEDSESAQRGDFVFCLGESFQHRRLSDRASNPSER